MESTIPIRNLYYLLCYAWDALEERELIDVGAESEPRDTVNLLGRVLGNGVRTLMRRGFERGYCEHEDELRGIRGRVIVEPTVRRQLPMLGRAMCRFDELEHDTLANRIVRATLVSLARSPLIDRDLGREMSGIARMFRDVRPHRIAAMDFNRVILHRNNRHYAFVLQICELLHATLMPDETGAGRQFRDFTRDRAQMAGLFERFVFNFYVHHCEEIADCDVRRATIPWDGGGVDDNSKAVLPQMRTDICLMRNGQPLVIDCKFYGDAFQYLHGTKKLNSGNLYQLFSYVQNAAVLEGWSEVEGMLLYPETGGAFEYEFRLGNVRVRAVSVDLHAPWRDIHRRLIQLAVPEGGFVKTDEIRYGAKRG